MATEVVIHLRPEWHEKILEVAHSGSEAERCLKSAVYRPAPNESKGEYVLHCDEDTMHRIFAMADLACPEAIPAMTNAYRTVWK